MPRNFFIFSMLAALNLTANANDTNSTHTTRLDGIVVTSVTGFESFLKDEVKNMTVITSEEMEARGYRNVNEALEKAPGVSFMANSAGLNIDVRGQGDKANTSVKVLVDGIALNMIDSTPTTIPTELVPIEDVERIEIIPGGGSVLYGSGTTGGVINIIRKKRGKDLYANISTKIASYSYKDLNLGFGGKVSDKLYLKMHHKNFDQDSHRYSEWLRGYHTGFDIDYQINDYQNIQITPSYSKTMQKTADAITAAQLDSDRKFADSWTDGVSRKKALNINYNIKATENLEFNLMPFYQKIETSMLISQAQQRFDDRKIGAKFKGKYDYGSGEFIAGYDYAKNSGLRVLDNGSSGPFKVYTDFDLQKQTHSFYLFERHHFTDQISLGVGYRYEKALYDIDRYSVAPFVTPGVPPMVNSLISHTVEDKDASNYAFEITPNFKYSDTGNIYFKFERGYVSPAPNQLVDKPNRTTYTINSLNSETFKTYEIGLKDTALGGYFSMTAFYTDTKDEIRNYALGASISDGWYFINLPKTRRYGFEFYAEQDLFRNLRLSQTYSYVDAKIKKGRGEGNRIPYVQKSKFVFGVDYEPIQNLNFISDIKWYSSTLDSYYDKIDDRVIVDFATRYKFQNGFSIAAGVKNLFNEKYNLRQIKQADSYVPASERNYYIEFKYAY